MRVGGEEVELLPEHAVWWPSADTLLVADLHWGKADTFQRHGIPVPACVEADDLARLDRALDRTEARRLLVLGDLVHGPLLPATVAAIAAWRRRRPVPAVLVRGNHDRHAPLLPAAWGFGDVVGSLREGPFAFAHAPEPHPDAYTWAGHVHPVATLRGRGDRLRLPCFHLGERVGILPAFGGFTGGARVRPARGDQVFVVVDGVVVALPA